MQGRTGINVEPGTMKRLAEIDNIAGVKEASGNISQIATILNQVPERFAVFSGDDAPTIPVIALGGKGLISTAGNEIPAEMTQIVQRSLANDFPGARAIYRRYLPLMEVNFIESNPIPVKAAMALMGLLEPVWRLATGPAQRGQPIQNRGRSCAALACSKPSMLQTDSIGSGPFMTHRTEQRIPFFKMTGTGNDFILIDNREGLLNADHCQNLVRQACRRKLSVGADGMILIERDPEVNFKWRFFNADASEAEMCGNGAPLCGAIRLSHGNCHPTPNGVSHSGWNH